MITLWIGLWRALLLAPLAFLAQKHGARRAGNHGGAQETGAARTMTAPIERASDWDEERRGGEVVEFRREGRL